MRGIRTRIIDNSTMNAIMSMKTRVDIMVMDIMIMNIMTIIIMI